MKSTITLSAVLLLLVFVVEYISCCESSNCCHSSSSDCCDTSRNCCQTTSSCCDRCRNRCRTHTCVDTCKEDCCVSRHCPDDSTSSRPSTATPSIVIPGGSHSSNTNNQNNNSIDFTASVNLNNVINNENRVHVPINVTSHNINNIVITSSGGIVISPSTDNPIIPVTPTTPCNDTKIVTVTVKIPVPIPVPGKEVKVPVPYPYPVPIPYPIPGCCVVITPCVTHYCSPYRRVCGQDCSHRYMYQPSNPCEGGCYKRPYYNRWSCSGSQNCQNDLINCSNCNDNFYLNFNDYQSCGGCYYS